MCIWTWHADLVPTHFPVFSVEVVCQTWYQSLQSCFSFLICLVLLSLQHEYSIEKAELLTEIVSLLELFLLEQRCHINWLELLNKMELGTEEIFPSCPCFISLWALHCKVTQTWADLRYLHNCGVWSFPPQRRQRICQFTHVQSICSKLQNFGEYKASIPDTTKSSATLHFGTSWGNSWKRRRGEVTVPETSLAPLKSNLAKYNGKFASHAWEVTTPSSFPVRPLAWGSIW